MSAEVSQPTRSMHPNSLAAIAPHRLKSGDEWRGNPGGHPKGAPRVDVCYARLGAMPIDDLRAYEPKHAIEHSVKQAILRACEAPDWQAAHAALKELADRLDGKPEQRKVVEHTVNVEVRQAITVRAYFLLFMAIEREEAIAAVDECFRLKAAGEYDAMLAAVEAAVVKDSEVVQPYLVEAERVVTGGG